jgi:Fanconi anemia group M protein
MFTPRPYQSAIFEQAKKQNLLVVLPTGLGKTGISLLLSKYMLEKSDKKILILAPTKPLVAQHLSFFKENIGDMCALLTGAVKPNLRKELYRKKIIFATPQTIQKDIEGGRIDLKDFSLIVFDEAHHAIGNYAYPFIAKKYLQLVPDGRILALTASPGFEWSKIETIKENLGIEKVEIRSESDPDIVPYVQKKIIEWVEVSLPDSFLQIKKLLESAYKQRVAKLKAAGIINSINVKKGQLIKLQAKIAQKTTPSKYSLLRFLNQAIKIDHCLTLLETQGIGILESYFSKLRSSKNRKDGLLLKDRAVCHAAWLTHKLAQQGVRHPKVSQLCTLLARENFKRAIVFANYRETVTDLVKVLSTIDCVRPIEFVGQKEGMSQKEQLARLQAFKDGIYNVLVATSIGEEGLDIADADLAIFYDNVPSPLRTIQRRGRVGRTEQGRIIVLLTAGTRDQAYYWVAKKREKAMFGILKGMQNLYTLPPKSL